MNNKNQQITEKIESKVKNTIEQYGLMDKNDKVIVCCSGGKDSTTALYLLNKLGYDTEALIIDLLIGDWSKKNLNNIKKFCKETGIKLHVVNMREVLGSSICYIRSNVQSNENLKNCTICGVIKRWLMNRKAKEFGGTKLVTGHNLDDAAETIVMNMLSGNPKLSAGLGPKAGITEKEGFVQRIKPLYFCSNEEIKDYSKAKNFPVLYEPCPCSVDSFRRSVRKELAKLEEKQSGSKRIIVESFLKILPTLKEAYKNKDELRKCKKCGEPSRGKICKACEILAKIK